jgi:hypothetical protein
MTNRQAWAVAIFAWIIMGIATQGIGNAKEFDVNGKELAVTIVTGIVESSKVDIKTKKHTLHVRNKLNNAREMYDITGVQVVGLKEEPVLETGSALHGKRAEMFLRGDRVFLLRILPPMSE